MEGHSLKSVFRNFLETDNPDGISRKIAEFLASEKLSRTAFKKMLDTEGLTDIQLKEVLFDQVLYYANVCVQDHELTDNEQNNLLLLNLLFDIKEGDFIKHRKRAIQNILSKQISQVINDRLITQPEEILLANLQRIFGLSTKEYVALIQPSVDARIEELKAWMASSQSIAEREKIETCIRILKSI